MTDKQKDKLARAMRWPIVRAVMPYFGNDFDDPATIVAIEYILPDGRRINRDNFIPDQSHDDCQLLLEWLDEQPNADELWERFLAELRMQSKNTNCFLGHGIDWAYTTITATPFEKCAAFIEVIGGKL